MEAVGPCLERKRNIEGLFHSAEFFARLTVNLDNVFGPIPVSGEFTCMKCAWTLKFAERIQTQDDIRRLDLITDTFFDRAFQHNIEFCVHPTLLETFPDLYPWLFEYGEVLK